MSHWFTPAQELLLKGQLALDTQDLRALMVMTHTTAGADRDVATLAAIEVLDECDGAGYTRLALTGEAVARDDANNLAAFDADDLIWPAGLGAGSRPNAGVVIYRQGADDAASLPVAYVDGGPFPFVAVGNPVTIAWSAAGVLQLGPEEGSMTGRWADVTAYGAVGDGVADDTVAIQAAIDSYPEGGPVFLPAGIYRVTSPLTLRSMTELRGTGYNRYAGTGSDVGLGRDGTRIDASGIGSTATLLNLPVNSRGIGIADLGITGPFVIGNTSTGLAAWYAFSLNIDHVFLEGFGRILDFNYCQGVNLHDVFLTGAALEGLRFYQGQFLSVAGGNYANCVGGNILVTGGSYGMVIDLPVLDEGGDTVGPMGAGNVYFEDCSHAVLRCPLLYLSHGAHSLRVGATSHHISIYDTHITPFAGDRVPLSCIKIDAGATNVRLVNIITDPNGGGDIIDDATDTLHLNVNGKTKHPVIATASLPAAGAAQDGRILIEDAGAGNQNVVLYSGGSRYRIDGGAAF